MIYLAVPVVILIGVLLALATKERGFLNRWFWFFSSTIPILVIFTAILLSLMLRRATLQGISASILWPVISLIPSLVLQPETLVIGSWMYLEALYVAAYILARKLGKRAWNATCPSTKIT